VDNLQGTAGDDAISGLDGDDYLIDQNGGNDQLLGSDGNDYMEVDRNLGGPAVASTVVMDGAGNDTIGETSWTIYLDNGGSPADLLLQFEQSQDLQLANASHIDHGAWFT
jgi:Ca2+-binding RTX toxin-like protein